MAEKQYLILLDSDARKRHYHITASGRITKFVVQLDVKAGDEWKEVIRYDCSHDFAHKDCYNIKGQCRKAHLHLDYEDTLTLTDDALNKIFSEYLEL